jgi:hypothetical protein
MLERVVLHHNRRLITSYVVKEKSLTWVAEHCFEQLRQAIQCALDLTPVPLRPYGEAPNINIIGTPQTHTCRDWGRFRDWYGDYGMKYGNINSGGTR